MPVLDFHNEQNGRTISVMVKLSADIEAFHTQIEDGVTYKRIYAAPAAAVNVAHKDGTKEDFGRITDGKKMTVGQMQDLSKELSVERAAKNGNDPVKEQFYRDYEKRIGDKHQDEKKRIAREALAKRGIRIR